MITLSIMIRVMGRWVDLFTELVLLIYKVRSI